MVGDRETEREPSPEMSNEPPIYLSEAKKSETVSFKDKYDTFHSKLSTRKFSDGVFAHDRLPLKDGVFAYTIRLSVNQDALSKAGF